MNFLAELAKNHCTPTVIESVLALLKKTDEATQIIAEKEADLERAHFKIEALTFELAHLRRIRFAQKSESFCSVQRDLFEESQQADIAAIEAEIAAAQPQPTVRPTPPSTPRPRAGRQPLPDHLPRIDHRHEPESTTCKTCTTEMVLVREDITEQLDVEPANFFVNRHIRPQYACRCCETMHAAPIAPAIIDGGLASPGLLAWVVIKKFLDHTPLDRVEQIAARSSVVLSRSTLAEWVGRTGVALQPLANRLAELLLKRIVLHADETPVQQLDPGQGKTKRAY